MTTSDYLKRFLRGPAWVFLLIGAAGGAFSSRVGLALAPAILAGILLFSVFSLLFLISGLGPRFAAAAVEREESRRAARRLAAARDARDRLAALRLAEPAVQAARDHLVLEAGRFLEEAARAGGAAWEPRAVAAIEDSVGLVQAWLREADESSSERRFGAPDAHVFPEAATRVAAALRAKAAEVSRGRDELGSGPTGADLVAIEEELK